MSPEVPPPSSASELLDQLALGDVDAALALVGDQTVLKVPGLNQAWHGRDEIAAAVAALRTRFEGLEYRPHTRHIGSGRVVDDATFTATMAGTGHPFNSPANLRLTHEGDTVAAITATVPPIVLRMGQGQRIDPRELAVALAVTTLMTPEHGLQTFALSQPAPTAPVAPPPAPVLPTVSAYDPPKPRTKIELPRPPPPASHAGRRTGLIAAAAALVVALVGGGAWAVLSSSGSDPTATPTQTPTATVTATETKATTSPSPKPSKTPTPTKSATPKPTVVLTADLAFARNSAQLSRPARAAILRLADRARRDGVRGVIRVDGYTDNLGSAASGQVLSQARADAVAGVLRNALHGLNITITAVGHGEADPVASNSTEAGRSKNRRVTITLPTTKG